LESPSGKFQIPTFEEFINIALDAPRVVGIYPEIKNPVLINQYVSISFSNPTNFYLWQNNRYII
jgi:glycerophosphoryl diester phosphodiesterase